MKTLCHNLMFNAQIPLKRTLVLIFLLTHPVELLKSKHVPPLKAV
jgi:hypothetical protein